MGKIALFFKIASKHWRPILYRNAVTLANTIFIAVCLILLAFREFQDALFLSSVVALNIAIGTIQGLRAKVALEQLQILTTPKVTLLEDGGSERIVTLEDVKPSNIVKLTLGDQIPADGRVKTSYGLEINESLLTGESKNIPKNTGDSVLAGSFVVAGSGTFEVMLPPEQSFVSRMTAKIKQYTLNLSPIQRNLATFINYMSYVLVIVAAYIIFKGLTTHEVLTSIIKDIASLTATLIPQGLILATTVFFVYGAVRMFHKQVLLQEINSTEKIGRIRQLCVDKTGTLTENRPVLEQVITCQGIERRFADQLADGYFRTTMDTSQTAKAIQAGLVSSFPGSGEKGLPFSSERKYGLAGLRLNQENILAVLGAPDILLGYIADPNAKQWVKNLIDLHAPEAKRLVLLAKDSALGDRPLTENSVLEPVALYILSNPLRPGTRDIIRFFQERQVHIRVISGDNPQTVQAIARQAGIHGAGMVVTGPEMENWSEKDFEDRVPAYHLFARISPEQKERIITGLKRYGFTAMVGDGANDALAIKKADLGIAMFDGAPATRQIAQVVLMNNSFAALPDGVSLAETVITNIELIASIFFNKITAGLFLFIILAMFGYTYPLSPRNITLINYFTVGLPLFYWAMFPAHKAHLSIEERPFLHVVLPFSLIQGTITALAGATVFLLGPQRLKLADSNSLVVLVLIGLGFWFFVLAPMAYNVVIPKSQRLVIKITASLVAVFLAWVFLNARMSGFFNLEWPGFTPFALSLGGIILFGWLQYQITKRWFTSNIPNPKNFLA